MRASMAYFAGVGTVVAAVAVGLGGGLLISNIVSPHEPRIEMSKLEQRMSSKPTPVSNAPSEPVSYLAATAPAASSPITIATRAANRAGQCRIEAGAAGRSAGFGKCAGGLTAASRYASGKFRKGRTDQGFRKRFRQSARRRCKTRSATRGTEAQGRAPPAMGSTPPAAAGSGASRRRGEVREETEPRQVFTAEPVRLETPRINLFDME